jgi:hypothetical protein
VTCEQNAAELADTFLWGVPIAKGAKQDVDWRKARQLARHRYGRAPSLLAPPFKVMYLHITHQANLQKKSPLALWALGPPPAATCTYDAAGGGIGTELSAKAKHDWQDHVLFRTALGSH